MGDPNASIPTPQPVHSGRCSAATGGRSGATSLTFVSQAALRGDIGDELGLRKRLAAVQELPRREEARHGPQRLRAGDGDRPADVHVRADGQLLTCEPATVLPLAQRYFLF
jgi:urease subunit alpha